MEKKAPCGKIFSVERFADLLKLVARDGRQCSDLGYPAVTFPDHRMTMNSSKSSKDKSQSIGNILRVGFVGIVVTAICVWMVLPPLETFRFSKYDVSSQQELVMELTSIPDVGPRPMVAFSADGSTAAYLSKMTGTPPEVEFQ